MRAGIPDQTISQAGQGRISRTNKLKPGRHTLIIAATNSASQRSNPKTLGFTIVT